MLIANCEIEKPIVLAPMAGVTDVGFRAVASDFGADATVTEMLSARAMLHNPKKTGFMTLSSPSEKHRIAQIFGHEADFMQRAICSKMLQSFDGFDINMGCPAPKIVKNGEGAALMDNLPLAAEIICACKKATDKQVSVKFRKGCKSENFLDFARMCQDCGADFVTFHARTVAQGYSGRADLDAIATVKAKLSIPVIGNGDVVDEKSLQQMWQTGVDGVMIGRGALGKPWIFAELKNCAQILPAKISPAQISPAQKVEAIKKHVSLLRQHFEDDWLNLYMRKHLLWYSVGLPLAAELRKTLSTCTNLDQCLQILENEILKSA